MRLRPLIALTALLALGLAACNGEDVTEPDDVVEAPADDLGLAQDGVLQAGSDIDFPPFEFVEDGEIKGFDIDLMEEIGRRLGVEVEWVDAAFDTLIPQLAADEFDAIVAAMTITEERAESVDFSEPYFEATQALVARPDSDVTGVADLAGMSVGAQDGTTGEAYAEEHFTDSDVTSFPTYPAAFTALEADQIDAVLADLPVAAEQEGRSDLVVVEVLETDELYGIGVQQGNAALLDAIDDALAEMIDDGTYAEIYSRWFEGDVPPRFAG